MSQTVSAIIYLIFVVISVGVEYVSGQNLTSPCPDVFEYRSNGALVYGVITVQSTYHAPSVHLEVIFVVAASFSSDKSYAIHLIKRKVPLQYRVGFPITSPLPRPASITVNGNVICDQPTDSPEQSEKVTITGLNHTFFLNVESMNEPPANPGKPFFTNDDDDSNVTLPPPPLTMILPPPPPTSVIPAPPTELLPPPPPMTLLPLLTTPSPPTSTPGRQTTVNLDPPQTETPSRSMECGVVFGGNELQPLVFNGHRYHRGDWPWVAAIYRRQDSGITYICAGTLVSDRHVVTAAHCMRRRNRIYSNFDIVVKLGAHDLDDWTDDVPVSRKLATATAHELYDDATLANDILVMTLARSVEFNANIRPACLWDGDSDPARIVGVSGVVVGWGVSESNMAGRGEPRMVRVPIASNTECRASRPEFHMLTSANTICAGDRKGSGPCLGDSGGGLYLEEGGRWRLRGVVSISLSDKNSASVCNLNEYVVFTDSAKYFTWIQNVIRYF